MEKLIDKLIYCSLNALFFVLEKILPREILYPEETKQTPREWRMHLVLGPLKQRQTRAGATAIKDWIESETCKLVAIIAPNKKRARYELIEGENGLLQLYKPSERPKYIKTQGKLVFKNGAIAFVYGARRPDSMCGLDFDGAWVDQICDMTRAKEMLFNLQLSVRQGCAQIIVTSTLKNTTYMRRLIKQAEADESVKVTYSESPRHTVALKLTWALKDRIARAHTRLKARLRTWELTLIACRKGLKQGVAFYNSLWGLMPIMSSPSFPPSSKYILLTIHVFLMNFCKTYTYWSSICGFGNKGRVPERTF